MPSPLVVELFTMITKYLIPSEANINILVLIVTIPDVKVFALCRVCIIVEGKRNNGEDDSRDECCPEVVIVNEIYWLMVAIHIIYNTMI